jgi:hypothetical protein
MRQARPRQAPGKVAWFTRLRGWPRRPRVRGRTPPPRPHRLRRACCCRPTQRRREPQARRSQQRRRCSPRGRWGPTARRLRWQRQRTRCLGRGPRGARTWQPPWEACCLPLRVSCRRHGSPRSRPMHSAASAPLQGMFLSLCRPPLSTALPAFSALALPAAPRLCRDCCPQRRRWQAAPFSCSRPRAALSNPLCQLQACPRQGRASCLWPSALLGSTSGTCSM